MALRAEVNRTSGETHHTRIPCSAFRGGPYQESLAGQDRGIYKKDSARSGISRTGRRCMQGRLERPAVSFGFP